MARLYPVKTIFVVGFLVCGLALAEAGSWFDGRPKIPEIPTEPFSPSQARTEGGKLIPVEQFFPAARCARCHADTHAAWSESLHRNAAREPFYRESADILLRTRGIEFTRHCESCHTPVALFSGMLSKESGKTSAPFTALDDEGVSCAVCHSITAARLDGTGSYTIRRPALLAREDGTPVFGEVSDEQILADIPGHKRAVMRPLLKQPEFCATCHKVTAPPSLNGYKQLTGFSAYDEWQQSGASHEAVAPFYRRAERADCRACHMPKVSSSNDRAAKGGKIASHRWLGANTAAPLFYGQTEQAARTEDFLRAGVLSLDIFAVKSESAGETVAPLALGGENRVAFQPEAEVTAEVVVSNRNAAHSFPPEVRDLYEAWVEFEALDATGKAVFHSGFVKPDGMLDASAHVYKTILLDESGRPITRHQIWLTRIKGYDQTIQAGRSDVARFRFRLPRGALARTVTLRARANYRRLNQEYTGYVLERQLQQLTLPIVKMAEAEVRLVVSSQWPGAMKSATVQRTSDSKRWNDYGIGLLEQAQYGAAAYAFHRANELDPGDASLLVNAALAEMRTERFAPERPQLEKAAWLLERALQIDPMSLRARFYRALVWRGQGKVREAVGELAMIAGCYPRDREAQRQLGQTLYTLGELGGARTALEAVLGIDPNDAGAYQLLAPIYAREGEADAAARAGALYLQWRDDPSAAAVASRFFAAHPEWQEERVGAHAHTQSAAPRAVLTGAFAAPVR